MTSLSSSITSIILILSLTDAFVYAAPGTHSFSARIPIIKSSGGHKLIRRQGSQSGAIGLGDSGDNSYSVQVQVGSNVVPVIFDTGSSDLWSISSDCSASSCGDTASSTPQISSSSLKDSGTNVELDYGDSSHPTFAAGRIMSGTVTLAGLSLNEQFVAAVDQTNTSLSDEGLSGIFGIGFPNPLSGSVIFADLLEQNPQLRQHRSRALDSAVTDAFIEALPTQGPFMSRLVANGQLKQPMFTVTLEREDVEVGGNVGQLTIGELPNGVSNSSLTWVPVRLYTPEQSGLPAPSANPNEAYPERWEVPIDDVILNGQTLPKPTLPDGVGYTVLIDSGTSFIAGPQEVVSAVYSALSIDSQSASSGNAPNIDCTQPVHLEFVIGGKNFPVDPRDFLSEQDNPQQCNAGSLLPTDPPSEGALMSWILGDPFMKSNLVAFYFGNLTFPSVDPPRLGFLSTVPSNADASLGADVKEAENEGSFIVTSVTAPVGTFAAVSTNAQGVAQAPTGAPQDTKQDGGSGGHNNSGASTSRISWGIAITVATALASVALL